MSTYRLYKSPNGDIVRVKMGFSWQAFFVGSLSAVVRRTWLLFVVGALYYVSEAYFNGLNGVPTLTSRTAASPSRGSASTRSTCCSAASTATAG